MGILVVGAEVVVVLNALAASQLFWVWIVLGLITLAGTARSRFARAAVSADDERPAPVVSLEERPARRMAVRSVALLALAAGSFAVAFRVSDSPWPSWLPVSLFVAGVLLLLALDVVTALTLVRFGRLVVDVFKNETVAGRDTLTAYCAVTVAFGISAVAAALAGGIGY